MAGEIMKLGHGDVMKLAEFCSGIKDPIFVWGPPGCGKTEGMEQLANKRDRAYRIKTLHEKMGGEFNSVKSSLNEEQFEEYLYQNTDRQYHYIVISMSRLDAVDIRGLPKTEGMEVIWALPKFLPKDPNFKALMFFDELNTAMPSNLPPCYQLMQSRRLDEYELPPGIDIVAAGNRKSDKGVTFDLPSPLADRFTHVEMEVQSDDFVRYAVQTSHHPDIVGFIMANVDMLQSYDRIGKDVVFRTPRSWSKVSEMMKAGSFERMPVHLKKASVGGRVGADGAQAFFDYLDFAKDLPAPDDILTGKVKECNLTTTNALFAVGTRMNFRMAEFDKAKKRGELDDSEFTKLTDNYFQYLLQYKKRELVVSTVVMAIQVAKIGFSMKSAACKQFITEYQDIINAAFDEC